MRVVLPPEERPARAVVRRRGTWTLQSTLDRYGLGPVAGVDEAGRGACAGPLVIAACVLRPGDAKRLDGLTDSKLLTAGGPRGVLRAGHARAQDHAVVVVGPTEVDRRGVHVANIEGMRRAVAAAVRPARLRADRRFPGARLRQPGARRAQGRPGRRLRGRGVGAGQGDPGPDHGRAGREFPQYGFAEHKGYCTPVHDGALAEHGPSPVHRYSFVNVRAARDAGGPGPQ